MPQIAIGIAVSLAISVALTVARMLLFPPQQPQRRPQQQTQAPRPADGKYNLKQNVPSLSVVYGRVKKGGDYVFLEEYGGTAFHITVWASHRIEGFVQHYLHDEAVTLDGSNWVATPAHFDGKVRISTKLGLDAETAWGSIVGFFPTIWTNDHRGDGLAQVVMECLTVAEEHFYKVYPQQMPEHTAVGDGKWLFDPREESHDPADPSTWAFSTNLALIRLDHLTQPWGGKLMLDDMYLPDWAHAADVCDEGVENRDGEEEPRYHGGLWFRHDNDPVDIGRTIDEAADLVIYERADGKIGVHAGEMVARDVRITVADIVEIEVDPNRRAATTVLAVRGRFTDPAAIYNTVDAAIYGEPYPDDDTQRTKTVDNQAVQRHNHIQRLQKLAHIRANAPRVKITIGYDVESPSRLLFYRRFIDAHYPLRGLDEAIIEITGKPRLNLEADSLSISFEGRVVPATLYDFEAAEEEGVPGGQAESITPAGVPVPTGLVITSAVETLVAGQTAVYGLASWTHVSEAFTYELEYQLSDESEPPLTVMSQAGLNSVRTIHLRDGAEYQFRLRTWSNGKPSDWTAYVDETVSSDVVAPGQPVGLATSVYAPGEVHIGWTTPNSPNLAYVELYRGATATFGDAVLIYTDYTGPNLLAFYSDVGLASATTYYYWVRSFNASGIGPAEVGPESETV